MENEENSEGSASPASEEVAEFHVVEYVHLEDRDIRMVGSREGMNLIEGAQIRETAATQVLHAEIENHPQPSPESPDVPMESPKANASKEDSPNKDDGQCCTICFEPWGISGGHRLVSLKCGHLFGNDCIERWLRMHASCPQCNAKSKRADIRVLYAKALRAVDTTERDRALQELQKEKEARRKLELEHEQSKLHIKMLQNELSKLRHDVAQQNHETPPSQQPSSSSAEASSSSLRRQISVSVSANGGARVLSYSHRNNMIAISTPSQNSLFNKFGVRKLNSLDFKSSEFCPLHEKQIRDLAFSPGRQNLLLSVSLDKKAKLTNVGVNYSVHTFTLGSPIWSCCWNQNNDDQLFLGTQGGEVLMYDVRQPSEAVKSIKSCAPVVGLQYLTGGDNQSAGVIATRLGSCHFYEGSDLREHELPIEGPFTSVNVESSTKHVLLSCRPNSKYPTSRHIVFNLKKNEDPTYTSDVIHVFQTSSLQKQLCRSSIFLDLSGKLLGCVSIEASKQLKLFDASTGDVQRTMSLQEVALDICPITVNSSMYLGVLGDKQLTVFPV